MTTYETKPLKPDDPVSKCCGARLRPHEGEEGTHWYTCSQCGLPADPREPTPSSRDDRTDELKETEAAYKVASEQAEQLRSRRNELVLQALADGLTHAQISEISGLSRGRIGQIAQTGEKKP